MFKNVFILIALLLLASCKGTKYTSGHKKSPVSSKPKTSVVKKPTAKKPAAKPVIKQTETLESTSNTTVYADVVKNYIDLYKETAKDNMRKHGIPASITLAQGILESGAGKGRLAQEGNNHFGIKCHSAWDGDTINHDDDAAQECFRKYTHASESFKDHSLFLTSRARYKDLFRLNKDDYQGWAKGLRQAGYATDPKYPEKLTGLIERYELYSYDQEVLGITRTPAVSPNTPTPNAAVADYPTHSVAQGDTLYNISKRYNLSVEELKQLNKLTDNTLSIGQVLRVK